MTDAKNALFHDLAELAQHYPEWRLGQLIANVAGWADVDIWDAQDEQLVAAAQAHLHELSPRTNQVNT